MTDHMQDKMCGNDIGHRRSPTESEVVVICDSPHANPFSSLQEIISYTCPRQRESSFRRRLLEFYAITHILLPSSIILLSTRQLVPGKLYRYVYIRIRYVYIRRYGTQYKHLAYTGCGPRSLSRTSVTIYYCDEPISSPMHHVNG